MEIFSSGDKCLFQNKNFDTALFPGTVGGATLAPQQIELLAFRHDVLPSSLLDPKLHPDVGSVLQADQGAVHGD